MSAPTAGSRRVVVIGGGIAGLAAAHRLQELAAGSHTGRQTEILLLERSGSLGGVIRTESEHDCLIELGPDSFITQKPWALDLCRRLGIQDRIIQTEEANRRTLVAFRGKLHPVPEGFMMLAPTKWWPLINSDLFSPIGKLRMALDLILPKRQDKTDESLSEFVVRRLGREALERIAQPMIGGVYTADPARLSLRATMPRFLEMEERYGSVIRGMVAEQAKSAGNGAAVKADSGARYSMFVSLDKGMQVLVDQLRGSLPPDSISLGSSVSRVVRSTEDGRWSVILADGEVIAADGVVISCASYSAADLLAEADGDLSALLSGIEYASSAVINLIFERSAVLHSLDGFGFVVPATEPYSFIACSFSSVKFAGRAPAGKVILRVFTGGAMKPELNNLGDDELLNGVESDLGLLLGISGKPLYSSVSRWPRSMPQYHVGHLERLERIESRLSAHPGLALAGNAYRGVGIPDCVRSGEQAAEQIMKQLNL